MRFFFSYNYIQKLLKTLIIKDQIQSARNVNRKNKYFELYKFSVDVFFVNSEKKLIAIYKKEVIILSSLYLMKLKIILRQMF